ncbi:MAG: septation protein SpoVG family protein [Rubripirellula sp.]
MEITEIRIKLMEGSEDRLRAFCSITIDNAFVVRDLKIIDGSNGPFVAMPSRKLSGHCQRCNHKNHLRASYCNHCGAKLQSEDSGYDSPQKLYADVAHPINSDCRELIQNAVITEFQAELSRYQQPGYRSKYDDEFGYEDVDANVVAETQNGKTQPAATDSRAATEPSESPARRATSSEPAIKQDRGSKGRRPEPTKADSGEPSGPPRPHFIDRTEEKTAGQEDDDNFGAGVF